MQARLDVSVLAGRGWDASTIDGAKVHVLPVLMPAGADRANGSEGSGDVSTIPPANGATAAPNAAAVLSAARDALATCEYRRGCGGSAEPGVATQVGAASRCVDVGQRYSHDAPVCNSQLAAAAGPALVCKVHVDQALC